MVNLCGVLLSFLLAATSTLLPAQAPELVWQHCLGGLLYDDSRGIQPTADGGCAVLGSTASFEGGGSDVIGNHGLGDYWLVKLDALGTIQWQRCYGGTGMDLATRLLATADGGYLMLGSTLSADGDIDCAGFFHHGWALKVDALGEIQWQTCLPGGSDGSGVEINQAVETADAGYLVVGLTYAQQGMWSENHGQTDYFAAKLNSLGAVEWLHCYGGSQVDEAWAIEAAPDGNYVIAGMSKSTDGQVTTGSSGQVWVIKVDPDGNLLWNRRMGGSSVPFTDDGVKDLVMNPDGSMLVVAYTASNDGDISGHHGEYDAWLVTLDGTGAILGQRCIGGSGNDFLWSATASDQGRYVLAGIAGTADGDLAGTGSDGWDVWAFVVDSNLNLLWQKCMGGSSFDEGLAVARNGAGELFISGRTASNDGDVSGNHDPGTPDIWVVKLSSDLSVGLNDPAVPPGLSVYPSPASDIVNVRLPNSLPRSTTLDVVDISGRIVLHNLLGGSPNTLQIDVAGWADGVYCLRLTAGMEVSTARFIKH